MIVKHLRPVSFDLDLSRMMGDENAYDKNALIASHVFPLVNHRMDGRQKQSYG